MSIHDIFKTAVNESVFSYYLSGRVSSKKVEEAYDDNAVGWLTRKNVLPSIFKGTMNGLRVPSAATGPVPVWGDSKYLTYPFVGINGYALHPAIEAKQGNASSYVGSNLERISKSVASVSDVLARQVSEGTGIPPDAFIIFRKIPITSAGDAANRRSMSLFSQFNVNDMYRTSTYPYNVQQALGVDGEGKLFVDRRKRGGVVINPVAKTSQMKSTDLMRLHPLTVGDVAELVEKLGKKTVAEQLTGDSNLSFPKAGGMLGAYMSGARDVGSLPGGNPDYKDFGKFAEENGFETEDGAIDFMKVRAWVVDPSTSAEDIAERLVIPYLLMSPFGRTYCWKRITPAEAEALASDIAVYQALSKEGGADISSIASSPPDGDEDDSVEFDGGDSDADGEGVGESVVSEAAPGPETPDVGAELVATDLMRICRWYRRAHNPTLLMGPRIRPDDLLRDDGRVKTKSSGVKRTFVRILSDTTELVDVEKKLFPFGMESLELSHSGTLDYSPLFDEFKGILDQSMPKRFPYMRIVGYMVSFEYDLDLERAYYRGPGNRKIRFRGLLEYYTENGRMFRNPTVFDVCDIDGGKYGNFLFSGYAAPSARTGTKRATTPPPAAVDENGLEASATGLHSYAVHGTMHAVVPVAYNRAVH